VRIRFSGRRGGRVPARVLRRMDESEELTRKNRKMTLIIALNYGGRAELADAARAIAREAADGRLDPDKVDEKSLARHLYLPDVPDPDLLVRTSGEYRLSNYLLWQLAYAELYFTDVLWPDFKRDHLYEAVKAYQTRDRRFGGLNE
jgi:undecaprenyl diphosphate synthase